MNNLNMRRVLKSPLRMMSGGVFGNAPNPIGPTNSGPFLSPQSNTFGSAYAAGRPKPEPVSKPFVPMGGLMLQPSQAETHALSIEEQRGGYRNPAAVGSPGTEYAKLREGGEIHASGGGIFDRIFQSQSTWQRRRAQRELDAENARATETQRINGLAGQERARFQQQPMRQVQNELDAENARGLETQRTNGLANAERQRFQQRAYAADHDGASMPAPAQPTQTPAQTPAQAAPPAQVPTQVPDNNQVKLQTPAQATASFRANNLNVIANQTLSPGAPKLPAAPAAPAAQASPTGTPTSQLRPNAFGDNTSFNSSFNPTQATHGTTTMQEWSAPGRSNGQPNAQDMGAANQFDARDAARAAELTARNPGPRFTTQAALRDGGELHALLGFSNPFASKTPEQKSAEARAEARARYAAQDAAAAAKAGTPTQVQAPTQTAPSVAAGRDGAGGNSLVNRELKAGTLMKRHGGDLRTGHGGDVPGTGHGDKIPAKYEPGEFVVSNDMLDAQPQLRDHLRGLREEVLAKKGMTPAMADAKALNGGRGLRAEDSVNLPPIIDPVTGKPFVAPVTQGVRLETPAEATMRATAPTKDSLLSAAQPRVPQDNMASLERTAPKGVGAIPGEETVATEKQRTAAMKGTPYKAMPPTPPKAPIDSSLAGKINASTARQEAALAKVFGGVDAAGQKVTGLLRGGANSLMAIANTPVAKVGFGAYGAYNAAKEGGETLDAMEQGNGAGILQHGGKAVASAASVLPFAGGTGATIAAQQAAAALPAGAARTAAIKAAAGVGGRMAAPALGLAYMGGNMIGDQIYKRMGEGTKDSIGSAINGAVRKLGGALGQDWGVDDTAMRNLRGQPLSFGVNAGAPKPAAAPQPAPAERNIEAENAEKLASGGFDLARHNAPGEIGQKRNTDREGNMLPEGQAQVWTGPKMGWQGGVSSDDAIKQRGLRDEQYQQRLQTDYDRATTGPMGWKTQADALAAREQTALANEQFQQSLVGLAPQQRAVAVGQHLQTQGQLEGHRITGANSLRTTQMNNDTSRETNAQTVHASMVNNRATQAYNMANADRTYKAGRADAAFTQREQADKDLTGKLESFYTSTNKDGKPEINSAAVAETKSAVTAHLSGLIAAAQARGDTAAVAELRAKGTSAMGEDGLQRLLTQLEVRRRAASGHSNLNPFGGKYIDSANPADYDIVGMKEGVLQNQYKLRGGSEIPTRMIDYAQGGNAVLPDSMGNTRTTRFDTIKNK